MIMLNPLNGILIAFALSNQFHAVNTSVQKLPQYRLAYVEYKGDFENNPGIYDTQLNRLLKWAVPSGLWNFPGKTELIIIYPDDPHTTPKNEQRMLMSITVPAGTKIPPDYKSMIIPAGEYAVGRFEISAGEFGAAWNYMYSDFIPRSGFTPSGGLSFEIKRNDSDTHPQKKHIVDICIPVKRK